MYTLADSRKIFEIVCIKIKVSQFLDIFVIDNTNNSILVQFSPKNLLFAAITFQFLETNPDFLKIKIGLK